MITFKAKCIKKEDLSHIHAICGLDYFEFELLLAVAYALAVAFLRKDFYHNYKYYQDNKQRL